jgi:hypothetical protein
MVKINGQENPVLSFVPPRTIANAQVPMAMQVRNKFIFNVQGNSAAYRFGGLLKYGCCVINIASPYKLWFEAFLKTETITEKNKDTIDTKEFNCLTIDAKLSNLETTIQWCLDHDAECEQIAKNGQAFFKQYFTDEFIYDYMSDVLNGVSNVLAQSENAKLVLKNHQEKISDLYKYYTIRNNFPTIKEDVKYNDECDLSKTLIVVPFRDQGDQGRGKQLEQFIAHYSALPKLHVLVVEQNNDGRKFNRGAVLNAGYLYATEHMPHIDTFVFHDVDIIIPPEIVNRYYGRCDDYRILHLGNLVKDMEYNPPFGRVIRFSKKAFQQINGFPNNFYGWGGEDDALAFRIHINNIVPVHRPNKSEGTPGYELETTNDVKKLKNEEDKKLKEGKIELHKWENICVDRQIWKINGVNSLQFKTNHYKEVKPNVHHIIVDLTPRTNVNDLFYTMFKYPTNENIFYYQEAYKHLSKEEGWDILELKEKQKKMEEDIQLMKDQQLYEKHVKEIEQKEKEEKEEEEKNEESPVYRVYNYADISNLTGGTLDTEIVDEESNKESNDELSEELLEEELDQEGGKLTLLTTIAVEPETEETKTINYN